MKQNITLAVDSELLKQARQLAARRHLSLSKLLAEDLAAQVGLAQQYEQSRKQALALLERKFSLDGKGIADRGALHDRQDLC